MAALNIDFTKVEATSSPEPLATGWYRALMCESEIKPTAQHANTGNTTIATKFTLLDPAFNSRPVFKNFNYANQNQTAQDIGWGEMKALNEAIGIAQPMDTQEWHNKPVLIHIKLKPARTVPVDVNDPSKGTKDYDANNDVNGFKNINDTSVTVISTQSNAQAAYQAPAGFINGQSPVANVGTSWNQASTQAAPIQPTMPTNPVVVTPAFVPPVAAPVIVPVIAPAPVYEMTAKAGGATREAFEGNGWTVELMLKEGYITEVVQQAPVVMAPPAAPSAPASPKLPAAGVVPPWLQNK